MKRMEEIKDIIAGMKSRRKYRDLDLDKLTRLMEGAVFEAGGFDEAVQLARLKEKLRSSRVSRSLPTGLELLFRGTAARAAWAAVILLGLSFTLWNFFGSGMTEGVVCAISHGRVTVTRDGTTIPLETGMELRAGDEVAAGPQSFADFTFPNDVLLRIREASRFSLAGPSRPRGAPLIVEIISGKVLMGGKDPARGGRAIIRTPVTVADIKGARFGVIVEPDGTTRYEVLKGRLQVRMRLRLEEHAAAGETDDFLKRLNDHFLKRSVMVRDNEVCVVDARGYRSFADAVGEIIMERPFPASGQREGEKFLAIASLLDSPRVFPRESYQPEVLSELRNFSRERLRRGGKNAVVLLSVTPVPEHALIFIDGDYRGRGRISFFSSPGDHTVEVKAAGYRDRVVKVGPGKDFRDLTVRLDRAAGSRGNPAAWLSRHDASYVVTVPRLNAIVSVGRGGKIEALREGARLWICDLGSPVNTQPVWDEENIYFTTGNEMIAAVSLSRGSVLWKRHLTGVVSPGSRLALADGGLYAGTTRGYFYRISGAGRILWQVKFEGGIFSPPLAVGNTVFVSAEDGTIYGIETGLRTVTARIRTGKAVSSMTIRGRDLIVADFAGGVACYDYDTGRRKWTCDTGAGIITDPMAVGNDLYVFNVAGHVYRLDDGGRILWKASLGDRIEINPVRDNHNIYILTDRVLYVLDRESGSVRWSFVNPGLISKNLALYGKSIVFGTESEGVVALNR